MSKHAGDFYTRQIKYVKWKVLQNRKISNRLDMAVSNLINTWVIVILIRGDILIKHLILWRSKYNLGLGWKCNYNPLGEWIINCLSYMFFSNHYNSSKFHNFQIENKRGKGKMRF